MKKKNQLGKGFWESPGVKLVLAIAIPVIAILILIMIYMIMKPETMVESRLVIDNFGELLPEVPAETEHRIEERLYEQVVDSVVNVLPTSGAMIRTGSTDGFTVQNSFHVGDFIVDIANVEQSYIVKYYYGELEGQPETEATASVMLYCIENPDEVIYGNFVCRANRDYVKPDAIQYILPRAFADNTLSYTYSLTSKSGYAVVVTYDPPESVYLAGKLEEFENGAMREIREYLSRAGVQPDDYEFVTKYSIVR